MSIEDIFQTFNFKKILLSG